MALSNWDCLAFGPDAEPIQGVFQGFHEAYLKIYKNYILVADPKGYHEESSMTKPFIGKIIAGFGQIAGFHFVAEPMLEQNSIFIVAMTDHFEQATEKYSRRYFTGIGCDGFEDPSIRLAQAMGIDLEKWEPLTTGTLSTGGTISNRKYLLGCESKPGHGRKRYKDFTLPMEGNEHLETQYVGVTRDTWKDFKKWLKGVESARDFEMDQEWLAKILKAKPIRYNQGDSYIGTATNQEWCGTAPGKAGEPFLTAAFKKKDRK